VRFPAVLPHRRATRSLALALALALIPASAQALAEPSPAPAASPSTGVETSDRATTGPLSVAGRVLSGDALAHDPSATVALRDLWLARPELDSESAQLASAMLARPTDGPADTYGNGYSVPAERSCGPNVCVHHVSTTADAATPQWVQLSLDTMQATWEREVRDLGYRPPRGDGTEGGDGRLDVYLKDLGAGLYGYCAAETRQRARTASGFCVLDNDYSPEQFPKKTPEQNLTVTAAHEFFHVVQYAYDYTEDPWMLESTATWIEEVVADDIDDNRQFLPYSQLQSNYIPLDAFSTTYSFQYGNWIFWEYLAQRFGPSLVRKAWRQAGSLRKDGDDYSVDALRRVLRPQGGFTDVYADFAAANTVPALSYAEAPGVPEYAAGPPLADVELTRAGPRHRERTEIDHLAAESMIVRPGPDLTGKRWRLRLRVSGPGPQADPAVRVLVHKPGGRVATRSLELDERGRATLQVPFRSGEILAVTTTMANVSTRFRCGRDTDFACRGTARDDDVPFAVSATAVKVKRKRR